MLGSASEGDMDKKKILQVFERVRHRFHNEKKFLRQTLSEMARKQWKNDLTFCIRETPKRALLQVYVHSSFASILKRKRKLVALLLLSYRCIVTIHVLWLFLMVPWVGMQCVIAVFSDHTHFLNSEDPDEMPHNATFHQGLHCLLRQKYNN